MSASASATPRCSAYAIATAGVRPRAGFLLRVNPLTSSDIVSYMAGAVGVPVWRVALGTFIGMAPLCYAQAYLAEQIFEILPGAVYVLVAAGLIYVAALVVWLTRK